MISVVFMIVFLLIAVMIVGLVLLQEGKGGGLTGMSTGMDGVMGAKNPLRRMTAYLFVFFVLMCLGINWYFHDSGGTATPQGLELPAPEAAAIPEFPAATETAPEQPAAPAPEAAPAAPAETPEAAPAPETAATAPAAAEAPAGEQPAEQPAAGTAAQ